MIFKSLFFKFGKFKCITRNKKHTDRCFTLHDCIRITWCDTHVILRLALHQQSSSEKDVEKQTDTQEGVVLHKQGYVFTRVFTLQRQVRLWTSIFFPTSLAINCTRILRHVPICILSFLMIELFQVQMKAPNCIKSSLELIHFTARMKKLLKCQQSTTCPSHTSSWELNKSDGDFSTKNYQLSPSSAACSKWINTGDATTAL